MLRASWFSLISSILLLSLSGLVQADDDEKTAQSGNGQGLALIFKRLDTNKDNQISPAEFEPVGERVAEKAKGKAAGKAGAMGSRLFGRLDTDKNGYLSSKEFQDLNVLREQRKAPMGAEPARALGLDAEVAWAKRTSPLS